MLYEKYIKIHQKYCQQHPTAVSRIWHCHGSGISLGQEKQQALWRYSQKYPLQWTNIYFIRRNYSQEEKTHHTVSKRNVNTGKTSREFPRPFLTYLIEIQNVVYLKFTFYMTLKMYTERCTSESLQLDISYTSEYLHSAGMRTGLINALFCPSANCKWMQDQWYHYWSFFCIKVFLTMCTMSVRGWFDLFIVVGCGN